MLSLLTREELFYLLDPAPSCRALAASRGCLCDSQTYTHGWCRACG